MNEHLAASPGEMNRVDRENRELYREHRRAEAGKELAGRAMNEALRGSLGGLSEEEDDSVGGFEESSFLAEEVLSESKAFYAEHKDTLHEIALAEDKERDAAAGLPEADNSN